MDKCKKSRLPRARIAHQHSGRWGLLVYLLAPLRRLRVGRVEVGAISMTVGMIALAGLLLGGLGAANPNGLSEAYTRNNSGQDVQGGHAVGECAYFEVSDDACEELWARAMSGIGVDDWSGEEDWAESQCAYRRVCFDVSLLPTSAPKLGL